MDIKDKLVTTDPAVFNFVVAEYDSKCSSYGKPRFPAWRKREEVRIATGFYQTSEVILKVEQLTQYNHALHVSRNDPTMVAYTPAVEAGNEDKQLTTTLGKFLRKHLLLVTDTWIADQVAAHMAEVNGSFECARTAAEIRWAYTSMPSDGSCMRYEPSQWYGDTLDVHPSEVYATENTYVAYIPGEPDEDGKPTVKARSVVYEKGNDKRYVRVYGAPVLEKILIRKGFVMRPLNGARLRRIPIPETSNTYVMPYLDGPGGAQSDLNCYVVDDGEALIVQHRDTANKQGEGYYAGAKNHGGARVTLAKMVDPTWVSDMTGVEYNTLVDGKPLYYITPIGTVGKLSNSELTLRRTASPMLRVTTCHEGANLYVWTYYNVPRFEHVISNWLDNAENRALLGYKRVTSKYDALPVGDWGASFGTAMDHEGKEILVSSGTQLVTVVGSDGVLRGMPALCVPLLPNRKDYRKCGRYNERDVYALKTCEKLTRSEGGSWFIRGVHEGYGQCAVSGKWYATKALESRTYWGVSKTVAKGIVAPQEAMLAQHPAVQDWSALSSASDLSADTLMALRRAADVRAASLVAYEAGYKYLKNADNGSLFREYWARGTTMTDLTTMLAEVNARCATGIWGEINRREIERFNRIVDMVRAHYDPYVATLTATIERLEAEAAGQQVITEGETV